MMNIMNTCVAADCNCVYVSLFIVSTCYFALLCEICFLSGQGGQASSSHDIMWLFPIPCHDA